MIIKRLFNNKTDQIIETWKKRQIKRNRYKELPHIRKSSLIKKARKAKILLKLLFDNNTYILLLDWL